MANKAKRRRQRQRAAAKRETMATEHKHKWYNYTVAYRVTAKGGPVNVISIKEYDEEQLFPFIMRIAEVSALDEFQVLDVHRHIEDGRVEVLFEVADWPAGVGTARSKGEFMRGMQDSPLFLKSNRPAGTTPLVKDKPAQEPKPAVVVEALKLVLKTVPLRWYTLVKV